MKKDWHSCCNVVVCSVMDILREAVSVVLMWYLSHRVTPEPRGTWSVVWVWFSCTVHTWAVVLISSAPPEVDFNTHQPDHDGQGGSGDAAVVTLRPALIDAWGDQQLSWLLPSNDWMDLQPLEYTGKALGELRPPPAAHLPTYRTSTCILVVDVGTCGYTAQIIYDHFINIANRPWNKNYCHVTSSLSKGEYLITLCVLIQGERGLKGLPVSFWEHFFHLFKMIAWTLVLLCFLGRTWTQGRQGDSLGH